MHGSIPASAKVDAIIVSKVLLQRTMLAAERGWKHHYLQATLFLFFPKNNNVYFQPVFLLPTTFARAPWQLDPIPCKTENELWRRQKARPDVPRLSFVDEIHLLYWPHIKS
jgi:hypothetical protein